MEASELPKVVPVLGVKVCVLPTLPGSPKLIPKSLLVEPVIEAALPPTKAELSKTKLISLKSLVLALLVAVPVKLSSAVVALVRVRTAVSPAGTLLTLALLPAIRLSPVLPAKVSPPVRVMMILSLMEPSKVRASLRVLVL